MTKHTLRLSAVTMAASLLFACQKQVNSDGETTSSTSASASSVTAPTCGMQRTQTQGGWGATPAGNNSGTYLHAHFSEAFANNLTVGCYPGNYYVRLTSAQAITDLLPVGGKAAILTANATNPASLKNVLVGQLVALKLSVGFDAADYNFGESNVPLGDMLIGSGAFKGVSVFEFAAIADAVLGGCNTSYTVQQVLDVAAAINENFDNGTTNNGFLVCPDGNGGGNEPPAA